MKWLSFLSDISEYHNRESSEQTIMSNQKCFTDAGEGD